MSIDQYQLIAEICPLRRDLVSDGFDQALSILAERFPLIIHRYATGTPCWTWRIPEKWTCDEAFVEAPDGRRVIDQAVHPLHVASYAAPIDRWVSRDELLAHLHVHPHVEDAPPFVFYYYQREWAFACGRRTRDELTADRYRVVIRSRFEPGELKVAEWALPGASDESFVLAGHLCHPAQANDGLSGVVTGLAIMAELAARPRRRYTCRLLITPETIGSIAWLSHHEALIPKLAGGIFLDMTGLDQPPALQSSFHGDTDVDLCCRHVHMRSEPDAWSAPYRGVVGNDERQFNAPGVRVPMLSYSRALPWGHPLRPYREYHSAADDMRTVDAAALERSRDTVLAMIDAWDGNYYPRNRFKGEVFLSGYDLAVDRNREPDLHRNMLKIMDYIDGTYSVVEIAERLNLPCRDVRRFIEKLREVGLVDTATSRPVPPSSV